MTERPGAPRARLLLIDDEAAVRRGLGRVLLQKGFAVDTAESGAAALDLLRARPIDVALVDRDLGAEDGLSVAMLVKERSPEVEVIVLAAADRVEASAAGAARAGAFAIVQKPEGEAETLALAITRAAERRRLVREAEGPGAGAPGEEGLRGLLGSSPRLLAAERRALDAARTEQPVLILGEPGTGKELLARTIHRASSRSGGPLQMLSAAALAEGRAEDELFGVVEAGGRARKGAVERAFGGTLVLEEVGALPASAQRALGEAMQSGEYRPRGALEARVFDARVVATSHDLRARVKAGAFREDLFYRLGVALVELPPLRRRRDDIPVLAYHFARRIADREGKDPRRFSAQALEKLRKHAWPGNVRQLERAIERAVLLSTREAILPGDLELDEPGGDEEDERDAEARSLNPVVLSAGDLTEVHYPEAKEQAIGAFDAAYVARLMARAGGNVSEAARLAGMDRANFRRLIRKSEARQRAARKG